MEYVTNITSPIDNHTDTIRPFRNSKNKLLAKIAKSNTSSIYRQATIAVIPKKQIRLTQVIEYIYIFKGKKRNYGLILICPEP